MGRAYTIIILIAGLLAALAAVSLESVPGYMDADYYYAGGLRIIEGEGGSEPYLWNYLNDPEKLPAPSFAYWMPLISIVASAGMALAGSSDFWAARLGFILLSAVIPLLTAHLSYRLTGWVGLAKLAGVLGLFSGYYLAYQITTDAFALYMLFGSLFIVTASGGAGIMRRWPAAVRFLLMGGLVGLMHLTRADGLLWLVGAGLAGLEELRCQMNQSVYKDLKAGLSRLLVQMTAVLLGYGMVMAPWFVRNLRVWGSLLPPGGSRAMWITDYPQTMAFPAAQLTPAHWLAAGWGAHFQAWVDALGNHIQTALAVQSTIVLFPFILIGLWKLRSRFEVRLGAAMWLVLLLVMSLVFPYAGKNGGFFHSGAALQPLFWAAAPLGIETTARWYAEKRRFQSAANILKFSYAVMITAIFMLTVILTFQRISGSGDSTQKWTADSQHYSQVETQLLSYGADQNAPVLVNNPPGYWLASRRPALVIPQGDEQTLLAAARQFHAGYLVLETTNPVELGDLYHGRVSPPELEYLGAVDDTKIYRFDWNGVE